MLSSSLVNVKADLKQQISLKSLVTTPVKVDRFTKSANEFFARNISSQYDDDQFSFSRVKLIQIISQPNMKIAQEISDSS